MSQELLFEDCPIITKYTQEIGIPDDMLRKLYKVRSWDIESGESVPFKWPCKLRTILPSGEELRVREYQKQGIHHLARMKRFINGDAVGIGKTLQSIAANCWVADRQPRTKTIVLATKSVTHQWKSEYHAFSHLRARVMEDKCKGPNGKMLKGHDARVYQLQTFLESDDFDVLVCKYTSLIGRRKKIEGRFDDEGNPVRKGRESISQEVKQFREILQPYKDELILITDEAQKYSTVGSAIRIMIQVLQPACGRVWALTATVIKNSLDEFYSIAVAIGIKPLGPMQEFYEDFCIYKDIPIGKGRVIHKLMGYKNVATFKNAMRPFFLGRSQRQVKEPLPRLITQIHPIELNDAQKKLLLEDIPNGDFILPPALVKVRGEWEERDRDVNNLMTQMAVMQLVANHPGLIDPGNETEFYTKSLSPKEEALLDLLDGELKGESTIIFSKYKMVIDRLQRITKEGHFTDRKFLRITGSENETQREEAKLLFQTPGNGYDAIFINSAAIEGINLQQAAHMICLDLPWGWGSCLQMVGRMVRMASPHSACTLHILVANDTIDEYTIETLKGKKLLFEKILGESHTAGLLDDKDIYDLTSGMETVANDSDFMSLLQAHIKPMAMKTFVDGSQLEVPAGMVKSKKMKKAKASDDLDSLIALWK